MNADPHAPDEDEQMDDADAPAAHAPPPDKCLSADVFSEAYRFLTWRLAFCKPRTTAARRLQALFRPDLRRVAFKASQYFLTPAAKVSSYARTLCLKLRYNAIYKPPNSTCPLPGCGCWDHATHLLGACRNAIIHGMICNKHNDGGQLVLTAFRNKSPIGNHAVIANLGNGAAAAHEHTLPNWLGLDNNRQAPDILIIKNWPQDKLDAGVMPRPSSRHAGKRVTLLFIEYKTCSDFKFADIEQEIWEKYTPHAGCPRPHRRHLFRELRAKGWSVEGLNAEGALGCSAAHDRMVPLLVGHAGSILQSSVEVVLQAALQLPPAAAHKLACGLNVHQVTAAARIFSTAFSLGQIGVDPVAHSAAGASAARSAPTAPSGVG